MEGVGRPNGASSQGGEQNGAPRPQTEDKTEDRAKGTAPSRANDTRTRRGQGLKKRTKSPGLVSIRSTSRLEIITINKIIAILINLY